jgi:hypothetical protein
MTDPLAIDIFCGLGGWTDGLLAEGYFVVGFDIERHVYGNHRYPAQLVVQDVLTLHGSQFRHAALIVASPPCQGYSYRAMPWSRAKALPPPDNSLFEACFRIQREACEAAGHHIPMVVENVRGAQKWVGRARWNFGSFYLWGDVPALMPITFSQGRKNNGGSWFNIGGPGQKVTNQNPVADGYKTHGMNWSDQTKCGQDFTRIAGKQAMDGIKTPGRSLSRDAGRKFGTHNMGSGEKIAEELGLKNGGDWFGKGIDCSLQRKAAPGSNARKAASAMIAKIPLPLSRYIASVFRP